MQQLGGPKTEEHETLKRLIAYHTIDIWIGSIGVFLNLCLLSAFFSKRTFFRQNVVSLTHRCLKSKIQTVLDVSGSGFWRLSHLCWLAYLSV